MAEFASNGKGNLGVTLGAIGTGLGVLNGGWGNLFGLGCNPAMACNENNLVNRYEAQQQARIAELETEVKLRDSNIYTDQKSLELYKYFDGEIKDIRRELCGQAVMNQKTADAFELVHQDIARERDERCCADNAIVNYVNATFYPKMVADVTTGTATTAQSLYNPLPNCGKKCCG
jgi:hypothetical protein